MSSWRINEELRKEGNDAFGKGNFKAALEKYERALAFVVLRAH